MTRFLLAAAAAAALAVPAAPVSASAEGCMPNAVRCVAEAVCLDCVPDPPLSVYVCPPPPLDEVADVCVWFPPWPPSASHAAVAS